MDAFLFLLDDSKEDNKDGKRHRKDKRHQEREDDRARHSRAPSRSREGPEHPLQVSIDGTENAQDPIDSIDTIVLGAEEEARRPEPASL